MLVPTNQFKARLSDPRVQYGIWVGLADPYAAEISAGAGFDWMVIDGEHSPNDLRTTLLQLQAAASYPVSPIVRPPIGDPVLIKQYLDIGIQTVLIPMVETAEQATDMVRATRYPPHGIRGVASARASRWGRVENYWGDVHDQMCVIVQVETLAGVENLDAIAAVDGVDGVFIGPSDLGAALGHLGQPDHAEVRHAVSDSIRGVRAAGKAAGVLSTNPAVVREYIAAGATFAAIAVDTNLLANATSAIVADFRTDEGGQPASGR